MVRGLYRATSATTFDNGSLRYCNRPSRQPAILARSTRRTTAGMFLSPRLSCSPTPSSTARLGRVAREFTGGGTTLTTPSETATSMRSPVLRTLKAVPTAVTAVSPITTTNGRAGLLATWKYASPPSNRTRRSWRSNIVAKRVLAPSVTVDPSGKATSRISAICVCTACAATMVALSDRSDRTHPTATTAETTAPANTAAFGQRRPCCAAERVSSRKCTGAIASSSFRAAFQSEMDFDVSYPSSATSASLGQGGAEATDCPAINQARSTFRNAAAWEASCTNHVCHAAIRSSETSVHCSSISQCAASTSNDSPRDEGASGSLTAAPPHLVDAP